GPSPVARRATLRASFWNTTPRAVPASGHAERGRLVDARGWIHAGWGVCPTRRAAGPLSVLCTSALRQRPFRSLMALVIRVCFTVSEPFVPAQLASEVAEGDRRREETHVIDVLCDLARSVEGRVNLLVQVADRVTSLPERAADVNEGRIFIAAHCFDQLLK